MTTALTTGLGRFIAQLRYEDIPAEARSQIALGFTDSTNRSSERDVVVHVVEAGGRLGGRLAGGRP